jgi:hypothetical protein
MKYTCLTVLISFHFAEIPDIEQPLYVNGQVNPKVIIAYYKQIKAVAEVSDEEAASLLAMK